jgi:hypothetical protein
MLGQKLRIANAIAPAGESRIGGDFDKGSGSMMRPVQRPAEAFLQAGG